MVYTDLTKSQFLNAHPAPRIIETRMGKIEYAEFGQGPAVLCLHGAMGGFDQGLILAKTVGDPGYRYIAVSRPGYLRTSISQRKSPELQADLYAALLDALDIDTTAVAAVSGGGPSAIHLGLRHPLRTSALILISTVAGPVKNRLPLKFHLMKVFARIPWFESKAARTAENDPVSIARRSIIDEALLQKTMADQEAWGLLRELQSSTVSQMSRRIAGTVNDVETTRTATYPLEQISIPTLIVHGSEDPLVPFNLHGRVSAAVIPNAEIEILENGGHAAIFTHRDQARARVTNFLWRHASPK